MKKSWIDYKIVIVSGASGGIGFEIVKSLIENHNCYCIGIARNEEKIKTAMQTLGSKQSNFSYRLFDVGVKENWTNFASSLINDGIKPDVLINNAGFMLPFDKFENYTDKQINDTINTNFFSTVYSIQTLLPLLKESSTPAIVNISSAAALGAVVGTSMYSASKSAVKGFTECLQQEYKKKIYIGGVYPGFVKTDLLKGQKTDESNNEFINKFAASKEKTVKKIVKGITKRKKRMVLGIDGKAINFFCKLMPKSAPNLITKVLKDSKQPMFSDLFDYKGETK